MRSNEIIKQMHNGVSKFKNIDAINSNIVAKKLNVSHKNLMRNIKKAINYQNVMSSEVSSLENGFKQVFQDYYYLDSRGREQKSKLMNEDAVLALVKVVDSQEAYNLYTQLMDDFKELKSERTMRLYSKTSSNDYTEALKKLYKKLKEEGSKQPEHGFYATIQRKIYKASTGNKMPKGGISHDILSSSEESIIYSFRIEVSIMINKELKTSDKTAREIREMIYRKIDNDKSVLRFV